MGVRWSMAIRVIGLNIQYKGNAIHPLWLQVDMLLSFRTSHDGELVGTVRETNKNHCQYIHICHYYRDSQKLRPHKVQISLHNRL